MISLNCPLVGLDVETTGVHPTIDRIVQVGLVKLYPDGRRTEWQTLVNPGIKIPEEAIAVHHITNEMVKDVPSFARLAPTIVSGLKGCDYCGYNVGFDLRMLKAELERCGAPNILNGRIYDAYKVYSRFFPRHLTAAYREYVGKELSGAHDALIDARAAVEVMEAQLERHGGELPSDMEGLHKLFFETPPPGAVDSEGKLVWRNGHAVFNFGKYPGVPLAVVDRSYLQWILKGQFSDELKKFVSDALEGRYPEKPREEPVGPAKT